MSSTRENDNVDDASFSAGTSRGVVIVVMGVSGSGKTTLGTALAEALSLPFIDADDLHPETNIDKMSRGEPLTDADRGPWLARVRKAAVEAVEGNTRRAMAGVVVACSALKASYRDVLRGKRTNLDDPGTYPRGGEVVVVSDESSDTPLPAEEERGSKGQTEEELAGVLPARAPPATFFVHPFGPRSVLLERMVSRKSHFMKADMLASQLDTLENPAESWEKGVVEIQLEWGVAEQVRAAVEALREVLTRDGHAAGGLLS